MLRWSEGTSEVTEAMLYLASDKSTWLWCLCVCMCFLSSLISQAPHLEVLLGSSLNFIFNDDLLL